MGDERPVGELLAENLTAVSVRLVDHVVQRGDSSRCDDEENDEAHDRSPDGNHLHESEHAEHRCDEHEHVRQVPVVQGHNRVSPRQVMQVWCGNVASETDVFRGSLIHADSLRTRHV